MKITTIVAFILFAGCNAITSPNSTTAAGEGGMVATVNGSSWSTVGVSGAQSAHATRDGSTGAITVVGANASLTNLTNPSSITLTLLQPSVSTVSLGITGNEGTFAFGTVTKDAYVSTTGSVTITKYDTTKHLISGSFNFTGYQLADTATKTVTVTNGSFLDIGW